MKANKFTSLHELESTGKQRQPHIRVAQIVGTWARRAEKVEEERENGSKWRERNVKVRYFLSQNVKIWYFFVAKR